MSSATMSETFDCSVDQFWSIISDVEKYHEFLSEVKKCTVIETAGQKKLVEYDINLIKNFKYRLWMTEEPPTKLSWVFESGDLFKVSNGMWTLQDLNGKTNATYAVEAKFKVFVPGPISKALVNVNLPSMMSAYQKRVAELFG